MSDGRADSQGPPALSAAAVRAGRPVRQPLDCHDDRARDTDPRLRATRPGRRAREAFLATRQTGRPLLSERGYVVSAGAIGTSMRLLVGAAAAGLSISSIPGASGSPGSGPGRTAPCLTQRHPAAFKAYYLGDSFAGLPLTERSRSCFVPPHGRRGGEGPRAVTWTSTAKYGTCRPVGVDAGCGPAISVETWPECDRNFSSFGVAQLGALTPSRSFSLSGSYKIPTVARLSSLSPTVEMYTGQTTIVIVGDAIGAVQLMSGEGDEEGPTLARQAAHALAGVIDPRLSSVSAARLRARAVDSRGCLPA